MPGPFVDTHAHLQEPEFREDLDAVITRAKEAGLAAIIVPGVDLETSAAAAALAGREPLVYFAAGFHPHEALGLSPRNVEEIRSLLVHPKAIAVGEIGLDYYRMHSPRDAQLKAFALMLDLAAEAALPVIVHCRDAAADVKEKLAEWSRRVRRLYGGRPLGVMHYFSGSVEGALDYVDLGFLVSVHTSVTHPKADQLRSVVASVALDALVLETDSPYGAPQSRRGKRNEPSFVAEAAGKIAEIKGLPLEEVARVTTRNAVRLFGLPLTLPGPVTGARA